jgi:anthranilate synthase/aminodeoxychorismate synthase-like glutamine amidotransferase
VRVLLLDNIDSFTYNIFHYLEALGVDVTVVENTDIDPGTVTDYDALVISPGPGLPKEAGKLMEVLGKAVEAELPVLGICLGMQAIAEYFGGSIYNQARVKHGQKAFVEHSGGLLFTGVPSRFAAGLYHSWAVRETDLPVSLTPVAVSDEGVMMALAHTNGRIHGVQFHPESILSEYGMEIFRNFLSLAGTPSA